jgi:two-component system chemotaxis sensor kinase CheA
MDMSKYRGMFLSESAEHLKSMGRLIIALEADPANREAIDTLFREAHSIKGMAASMGYEHSAELAHHLEDLMDGFRKGGAVPTPVIDRLLAGIDLLEGLLADISADLPERDIAPFLAATTAAAPLAPAALPAVSSALEPLTLAAAAAAAPALASTSSGEIPLEMPELVPPPAPTRVRNLLVRIDLAAEAAAPAARAMLILMELAKSGVIASSTPTEAQLRQGVPVRHLEVLLESAGAIDQIRQALAPMADVQRVEVEEPAERSAEASGRRDEAGRTVRVRTELLDRFINLTGELITTRYMLQNAAREGRWRDTSDGLDLLARLIGDLHGHVLQVRMMPLESATGRLPRLVRDLARKTGKEVQLRISGEELELDRAIIEELADPLVHLVRNAVDHGIDKSGEVTVRAWREKDLALVEIADNGRGMDVEKIRNKALQRGLIAPAQAKMLRDREVLQLVCLPGFSTAEQVTETSGRGVGMDVVKSSVESLGGSLEISSELGHGTRFLLKLPLTVAIIKILLVSCATRTVGIPITRVVRALELAPGEVRSSGRQQVVTLADEMIPLVELNPLLGLEVPAQRSTLPTVVTEQHGRKIGLLVDRFSGQREVFVKTLAFPLDSVPGVSGATVLGDGNVVFIIDPQALLAYAAAGHDHPAAGA